MPLESGDAFARVTIILVTYNSRAVIGDALASIPEGIRTIVVDNDSRDGTVEYIRQDYPRVEVISSSKNIGFGPANNLALAQVRSDFAMLMNPDARFAQQGAVEALIRAAERYPEAAIISPNIRMEDGTFQGMLAPFYLRRDANKNRPLNMGDVVGDACAFSVSGALMLLRMSAFADAPHFFDPNIFMYFEDDDICLMSMRRGYSVMLIPSVSVMHMVGKSSPPTLEVEALKIRHKTFAQLYVMAKHGQRVKALYRGCKLVMRSGLYALIFGLLQRREKRVLSISRFQGAMAFLFSRKILPVFR